MNDIIEDIFIKLLESRGNLSFDNSKIDDRRETMPIRRSNIKNRIDAAFVGDKTKEDEDLLSHISATTNGLTINGLPFAVIEDEDFKKKRTKKDLEDLKSMYATVEHENMHSIIDRFLTKKRLSSEKKEALLKILLDTAGLSEGERLTFKRFKEALTMWGESTTNQLSVVRNDEPLAYLLDYLNDPVFRRNIKAYIYKVLKKEYSPLLELEKIEQLLREFDVDLKRVWKKIRKKAKEL